MRGKKRKRYSIRGKMITVNMGIMLGALLLCGGIFVFSVFFIVSDYIHHDMDFFLTTTADSMDSGLSYLEQVIYALRDSETVMEVMDKSRHGRLTGEECKALEAAFSRAVDISSPDNLGNVQMPLVLEASLFDRQGDFVSTGYYAMPTSEKEAGEKVFREVCLAYEKEAAEEGAGYSYQEKEGFLYLAFPLYNSLMDKTGAVLFKLNKEALDKRMEELAESYPGSFWVLCDRKEKLLDGGNQEAFWNTAGTKRETFEEYRYEPFRMDVGGKDYRVYRKLLPMELQVFLGIPENHAMRLMYSSVRIYVLLIAVVTGCGCLFLLVLIYRLTRPIEEITHKLQAVREGEFETKLPSYDSREFHEISEVFNEMTAYVNNLIKEVYEKQISIKEMELKFLQTQMNPHFMFNVLNTLSLQAKMDGNEELFRMISTFSKLIQAKIYRSGEEKVTLGQELSYVEYYLYLQSYRFGERLSYEITVSEDKLKEQYIPKLCIQLLVENAVVHGLEPKVGNGFVQVKVYRQEGCICIDTVDDGVGFGMDGEAAKDNAHNHVGLSNVHHMIQLMYGEAYGVTVFSSPGRGSTVRIRIPENPGNAGVSGKAEE
nr:sensor histidine kinase [uncultured Eisenbergiella sp.]